MNDKGFQGSPFGFQSHRFDLAGVHPKRKLPGTIIGLKSFNCNIGPGSYIFEDRNSSFSKTKLDLNAQNPGWKRSYEVEMFSKLPYILNKDLYLAKEAQKRKLGPGYYSIDYSCLDSCKIGKGVMSNMEERFKSEDHEPTPGPGNYGKHGIPHLLKEEGDLLRKSCSTVGLLNNGGNSERIQSEKGSGLPPNTYILQSFTDDIVKHQTGLLGAFRIFSLNRSKPIKTGHLAVNPAHSLAPGHYDSKSSIDLMNDIHKKQQGKFLKMKQYPDKPFERGYWDKPEHMPPDPKNQIAPGYYDPKYPENNILINNMPPFNRGSKRQDKRSNMFFTGNYNAVGPGRYDIQRQLDSEHVNSHENLFKSNTDYQLSLAKQNILGERLKSKNIPPHQKVLIDHVSTELSPCVDLSLLRNQYEPPLKLV